MLLEGRNLGIRYGKKNPWIVRGANIRIKQGETVGLVGPSGSGKTSLARILAAYDQPEEGSVQLDGHPMQSGAYQPVQLVFQHPEKAVNPRWRMRQIVNEGWQPELPFLQSLGIEETWLERWPNELSGGELQRFCVARSLGPHTKFLIADEMTTMLDAITQAQIWHTVMDIAEKRNLGLLIISHEPKLIKRLCSRVIDWSEMELQQEDNPGIHCGH